MRLSKTLCFCLIVLSVFNAGPVRAWNDFGHRLIACLAHDLLPEAKRQELANLLRSHPRFQEDFLDRMPANIESADEATQNRWIFTQAAVWPDIARDFTGELKRRFHRGPWHYINEPLFLTEEDRTLLEDSLPVNLDREVTSSTNERHLNVMQAIKRSQAIVADSNRSASDRSVHLCWILHLIGDLHQPMHTSALFTPGRFQGGDNGGNFIPLLRGRNLHSLWDGALGHSSNPNHVFTRSDELLDSNDNRDAGRSAAESTSSEDWLLEGVEIARTFVYHDAIREAVAEMDDQLEHELDPIELPPEYVDSAQEIAAMRAIEAGYRLSLALGQISASN